LNPSVTALKIPEWGVESCLIALNAAIETDERLDYASQAIHRLGEPYGDSSLSELIHKSARFAYRASAEKASSPIEAQKHVSALQMTVQRRAVRVLF